MTSVPNAIVDVLVLFPEYRERSALIDSAMEIVRRIASDKFRYTLVNFPEEDPRFEESTNLQKGQSFVTHSNFLTSAFEPFSKDRGFNTNFDYIDDTTTFERRIRNIQNWLIEEAEDYWYEMDRPDFKFDTSKTLGVYLNPNPHLDAINSGQLPRYKNVFFVQMSSLINVQNELHIHLAKFLWTAPFRFLFEDNLDPIKKELNVNPEVILKDFNSKRLRQLLNIWSKHSGKVAHDMRYLINIYLRGVVQLDRYLLSLQDSAYNNLDFTPVFNKASSQLEIKRLSIYLPFNLKERIVYQFLIHHPEGLSQSSIAAHRPELMQMFLSDGNTDEGFDKQDASKILDSFQFQDGLRVTVSAINRKFEPFIFIPKMKRWTIIRVGETYRLLVTRDSENLDSIFS